MQVKNLRNILVAFGNRKLPKTIMIFNMGSAKDCPSRLRGLCSVEKACYARKAEWFYKYTLPYRERQAKLWLNHSAEELTEYFCSILDKKTKRSTVNLFRFNESGDFYSQESVQKLDHIAKVLKERYGIPTYGYTARSDLDFSNVSFLVKGSNHDNDNNGKTIVVDKKQEPPKGFFKCPASCHKCSACVKGGNVAFAKH